MTIRRVLALCTVWSLLLGWPAAPAYAQSPTPSTDSITIEGWAFARLDLQAATLYSQQGVDTQTITRVSSALRTAITAVPDALGAAPLAKIDVFLLASKDDYRNALLEIAGMRANLISVDEIGHSLWSGRHPGIYLDGSAQDEDGRALWLIAHELTHLVERQLAGGRAIPQWFNEGVAEFTGGLITSRVIPAYYARRDFLVQARLASSAYAGVIPVLTPLKTQADWVVATRSGSASTYAAAALAIRQLVDAKGIGAISQTLTALGSGASFDGAFNDAFGQTVSSVDALVSAYAYGAFMGSFPVGISADRGALPVNERLQLAFVGLKPGEGVAWTFLGPGSCSGRGSSSGSSDGFSSFWFVVRADSQARCAGSWTAVGAGDQGSSGRFDFRFTATN